MVEEFYRPEEEGTAQFLPIKVQVISPDLLLPSLPAAKRLSRVSIVLMVMKTVRVWYAKTVTSLLPQPSVLGAGAILKLSWLQ